MTINPLAVKKIEDTILAHTLALPTLPVRDQAAAAAKLDGMLDLYLAFVPFDRTVANPAIGWEAQESRAAHAAAPVEATLADAEEAIRRESEEVRLATRGPLKGRKRKDISGHLDGMVEVYNILSEFTDADAVTLNEEAEELVAV